MSGLSFVSNSPDPRRKKFFINSLADVGHDRAGAEHIRQQTLDQYIIGEPEAYQSLTPARLKRAGIVGLYVESDGPGESRIHSGDESSSSASVRETPGGES